jgi:AAA family ATP:ADP antiporter
MLIAAGLLVAALALFNQVEHLRRARKHDPRAVQKIAGGGGFELVLRDRYLLLIACLVIVTNLVNTTGEFVLSNAVRDHALALVPGSGAEPEAQRREIIKAFYSDFFLWVNLASFAIQMLLVSRVIDKLGVRRALFVLPVIAFGAYSTIGIVGGLTLIRIAKTVENATDYSLQNTVRQALFLPTARAVKYKAKAAIDTFFVRAGDTLSALLVGVGMHRLGFGARQLAFVNLASVAIWIALAAGIAYHHRVLTSPAARRRARIRERVPVPGLYGPYVHSRRIG